LRWRWCASSPTPAGDISWDGEPIAGMVESDRALLEQLTGERR
jgi:hypothetical protein